MFIGHHVVAAQSKKDSAEDAPSRQPMRPAAGIRTSPSTDQKKVRRAMSRGVKKTARIVKKDCSGCMEPFRLDTDEMIVTMTRASNGIRGKNHQPAGQVSAAVVEYGGMLEWDCPLCGYAESEYDDAETSRALSSKVAFADGDQVVVDGQVATYSGPDWLGIPAPEGMVWVEIDGDVVPVFESAIQTTSSTTSSTATKESAMNVRNREVQILRAMTVASLSEQESLAVELESIRSSRTASLRAERDLDLANTVVAAHLTPVPVHTRHTSATDWVEDVQTSSADTSLAMKTSATLWFNKVSSEVRDDREEFAIQAQGQARRIAGAHGEAMAQAERAFLDHVAHLYRTATGEVDEEQSGNGESTVTDYANQGDETPLFEEDWDGQQAAEVHPPMPGAGGQTAAKQAERGGRYSPVPGEPFRWLEDTPRSSDEVEKQRLFPDGIPIRGDLTEEQQAWLSRRGAKTAGRSPELIAAMDLFYSLRVGDKVLVTRDGRPLEMTVSSEPAQFGNYEEKTVTVTLGVGRYSTEISPSGIAAGYYQVEQIGTTASRRTAGATCATCGAAIERDPKGEDNRSWHHNDGASHDHEAKPSGDAKESSKTAAYARGAYVPIGAAEARKRYEAGQPIAAAGETWWFAQRAGGDEANFFTKDELGLDFSEILPSRGGSFAKPAEGVTSARMAGATENSYSPCPVYEGHSFDKSTGFCSCGSNHHAWASSTNPDGFTASRKVAISLTHVGIDKDGNGIGTDPKGAKVTFRLTDKERKDLQSVLYSDLAINFSGVSIDQSDIISTAGRTAGVDAPDEDAQAGDGESTVEQTSVGDEGDVPMWPWEQDANTPGTGAADVASVATPGGQSGYPQPTASRKTALVGCERHQGAPNPMCESCIWANRTPESQRADGFNRGVGDGDVGWTSSLNPVTAAFRARVQANLRKQASGPWFVVQDSPVTGGSNMAGPFSTAEEAQVVLDNWDGPKHGRWSVSDIDYSTVDYGDFGPADGDWSSWLVQNNID